MNTEPNIVKNGHAALEEEISVARAQQLLTNAANHPEIKQRRLSAKKLARYTRDMGKGDWGMADSVIVLITVANGDEVPINGIHRLTAIVRSGCFQRMLVMHNGDLRDRRNFDRGFERTVKQQGEMEYDIKDAAPKIAAFRALRLLTHPEVREDISDAEIFYKIERPVFKKAFEDLHEIRKGCRTPSVDRRAIRSDAALAAFMFVHPQDPETTKRQYGLYLRLQCSASGPTQPLQRISELVRERSGKVNISSGSGRLPFLQKAAVLVDKAVKGKECRLRLDLKQEETKTAVKETVDRLATSWKVVITSDQQEIAANS